VKPEITASKNKRKVASPLSTEIHLITSSDEDARKEYFITFSKTCSSIKTKLVKSPHSTTELVVSLMINHEEHLIRALSDTVAKSSSILETYTSATIPFNQIG
jgi:hypothetical protein